MIQLYKINVPDISPSLQGSVGAFFVPTFPYPAMQECSSLSSIKEHIAFYRLSSSSRGNAHERAEQSDCYDVENS